MSSIGPLVAPLYLEHRDKMHRVAAKVLRGSGMSSESEDVVHEVVMSLLNSPPDAPVANWEAWLVKATKNKARDRIRSARVRHAGGSLNPALHDRWDGTDLAQEVAEAVDGQFDAALVHKALSVLTEQEREVVWKVYGLEVKQRTVADELGLTPGRVSQICKTGLARLAAKLQENGSESNA